VVVHGDGDVRGYIYERQREMRMVESWMRESELEEGSGEFVSRLRLLVFFVHGGFVLFLRMHGVPYVFQRGFGKSMFFSRR
jgi:hypothetical protein